MKWTMSRRLTRRLGSRLDYRIDSVKVEDCNEDYILIELTNQFSVETSKVYYKMNWNKAERSKPANKCAVDKKSV